MNEDELKELFEFAAGIGRFKYTGQFMHTYPGMDDNKDRIHAGCVELERRGLLKRCIDDQGHVVWIENKASLP